MQCAVVAKKLNSAKRTYLSAKVIQCANNPKELHKITDKLLVNQHQQTLPSDEDHSHLVKKFGAFFESKIDNIRQHFNLNIDSNKQILPNIEQVRWGMPLLKKLENLSLLTAINLVNWIQSQLGSLKNVYMNFKTSVQL